MSEYKRLPKIDVDIPMPETIPPKPGHKETQEEEYDRKFSEIRIAVETKDRRRRIPIYTYPARLVGLKQPSKDLQIVLVWLMGKEQLHADSRAVIISSVCTARSRVSPEGDICPWAADIWMTWDNINDPVFQADVMVIEEALEDYKDWWGDE